MVKQGPVVNQAQLELGTCFTHNQAVGVASEATNHGMKNASLDCSRNILHNHVIGGLTTKNEAYDTKTGTSF